MALGMSQSAPSLLAKTRLPNRALTAQTTRSGEAQLRSARVQIDREKLLRVVDLPFFISMRFKELENGLITLEVTGDGRFAYCEREPSKTTIYEGVLVKASSNAARFTVEGGGEEEEEAADKEATIKVHSDRETSAPSAEKTAKKLPAASIEGKALVKYERGEVEGHAPHLTNVVRDEFRFAITVRPSFEDVNMEAWLQPLFSRQRQQRKHLARVDANGNFMGEAFREKNLPEITQRPSTRIGFSSGLYLEEMLLSSTVRQERPDHLGNVKKGLVTMKASRTKTLQGSQSTGGLRLPAVTK